MGYFCREIELKLTVLLLPWDLKTTHNPAFSWYVSILRDFKGKLL